MVSELLFLGNPIIDTTGVLDQQELRDLGAKLPKPGHYPMEMILSFEAVLPRASFKGASGGAFTAAATAAATCSKVSYYGSCGRDFGLFKNVADQNSFAITDPVGNDTEPAGRCLLFLDSEGRATAGPFVNRGAASLFSSEMMPKTTRTCLPFIEGYLLSNWQQLPEFAADSCAIDLSSVFVIPALLPMIEALKQRKNLIVFANQDEAEMLLDAELGNAGVPSPQFHHNAVSFCEGGHVLVVKAAANGAVVYNSASGGENATWVPPVRVPDSQVVDTSNAGDCFAGAFLGCLAQGYDLNTAASRGARAGAECVTRYGNGFS